MHDLFSLSEGKKHHTDDDGLASVDNVFSAPDHNEQSTDSDTSVEFAPGKMSKDIPRDYSAVSDQLREGNSQGKPIILEDDESDGDTATRFTSNRGLSGLEPGGFDSRIPILLSKRGENDSVIVDTESQCSGEGVGRHDSGIMTRRRRRRGERRRRRR